mgnify:FL=1
MFAPYAFFFYAGSGSIVFRNQRYFIFDGFAGFFQLRHQAFRIICCKAKLLCCKGDAGGLDLTHCLDLSFHLGSAVGAVETFYDIDTLFVFGDMVKVVIMVVMLVVFMIVVFMIVVMSAAAPAVIAMIVMMVVMMCMLVLFMFVLMVVTAAAPTVVVMVVMMIVLMLKMVFVFM